MCTCFWNGFSNYSTSTEEDSRCSSHTVSLISPFVINDLPSQMAALGEEYHMRSENNAKLTGLPGN